MSLAGSRGLVRISRNNCELQAAMVAERVQEPAFYQKVTGHAYPAEYGERQSARRRGSKFEANLHQNNAALLRKSVAARVGLDPDTMFVRNLAEEYPGRGERLHAVRLHRTRQILRDLRDGRVVPQLIIQPQLSITTGRASDQIYVTPDFVVLDPAVGMYIPGEEKSFIVRGGVADSSDLDNTRRQAGAQVVALRAEAARVGLADRVGNRAMFVFASPFGLRPEPALVELMDAEVYEVLRAIRVLDAARSSLATRRAVDGASLEMLVDEIPISYAESCVGSCILATECAKRFASQARLLGDGAADMLGETFLISRAVALVAGAAPANVRERALRDQLLDALTVLGPAAQELVRRRIA
jgi:hypothetical protein